MKPLELKHDFHRYREVGSGRLGSILLAQGFWAICEYRVAHAAMQVRSPILRGILSKCCVVTGKIIQLATGIHIPRTCRIGKGLYIPHSGPIFIASTATLGDFCTIHPGVVIGSAGRGDRRGSPSLGDRVYLGVNAVVLGRVIVGSDSAIGAGAVVTKDVPAHSVMVGNPARCISTAGSQGLITSGSTG
jgi:serine O-acetyltransferase